MAFELQIDLKAETDVEEAIDNYISKSLKVAQKFYHSVQNSYDSLEKNPFFQIRYLDYRCLPIKGFPYMIHFTVDAEKNIVFVHPIINTDKGPRSNWLK